MPLFFMSNLKIIEHFSNHIYDKKHKQIKINNNKIGSKRGFSFGL